MVSISSPVDITYCEGARLLQDSQADLEAILVQRPNGNLTCKHCYLVIADTDNLGSISTDKDWPLVVSCHVQACASLHDRRAAYSCYACLERGKTSIETSAAALKTHLQSCDLIKDIQPTKPQQRQASGREEQVPAPAIPERPKRSSRPAPASEPTVATPERPTARSNVESSQNPSSRRPVPSNPFWPAPAAAPAVPNSPVTPRQPHSDDMSAANFPPPRSRREVPAQAVRGSQPSNAPLPEQTEAPFRPHADVSDAFNVPGGFPPHDAAGHNARSPFFQDFPPTPPPHRASNSMDQTSSPIRRKDVKLEASSLPFAESREDRSMPTRPTRAPPAPPVLSAPGPGSVPRSDMRPAQSDVPPFPNTVSNGMERGQGQQIPRADPAMVQQLAALGISRARAEFLLNQTGGDVNEAAELGFSEQQGSLASGNPWLPTAATQAMQPEVVPASPGVDRRNRRSK
ncbi:hypothetical protein AYO21_11202 [Fonsecaea monophora]|uniref:UBA domain-containing protein n=1 Tax=Fonsecaea monophora TaxID=254056 RepID=A0A177ERL4_9EURO|nr:hypothetical protein AYO21_11202 [Fonsecaea monophora]KAH0834444.1 hypothetical protein FOPE_03655 [Fonsecaea pedrosoi]OAG34654.1 hypothetical protein AYO21_11202 [Fonsecaea monophora]